MMHRPLLRAFGLALAALLAPAARAEAPPPSRTVRLLTVGNSFSHNATHHLGDLAKAGGDVLILREANIGGASFEVHLAKWEAWRKDPSGKAGLYADGRSLEQELRDGRWDFITIQQASLKSHDVRTYRPFAAELAGLIRRLAPGAKLMLHQTWEYRADDARFRVKSPAPGEPRSQDEMYAGLRQAYAEVAAELGAGLIPVGDAFHAANRDPQWGYRVPPRPFDPARARPGELPDQTHSLNVGWQWKKLPDGALKAVADGHHANLAGEYLGACVWYETLFGRDVSDNSFVPAGLDPAHAKFLRETAHRAVTGLGRPASGAASTPPP